MLASITPQLVRQHQRALLQRLVELYCRELIADDGSYTDSIRTTLARGWMLCSEESLDIYQAKHQIDRAAQRHYQRLQRKGV